MANYRLAQNVYKKEGGISAFAFLGGNPNRKISKVASTIRKSNSIGKGKGIDTIAAISQAAFEAAASLREHVGKAQRC